MFKLKAIGEIRSSQEAEVPSQPEENRESGHYLEIKRDYQKALKGLEQYKYIYVLFYLDKLEARDLPLTVEKNGQELGLFTTRSACRPNPLGLSIVRVLKVAENRVYISDIDAYDRTPILDIKPYLKTLDVKTKANDPYSLVVKQIITLYTDGACTGNPGPGAYAALIKEGEKTTQLTGFEPATTNNRMELRAVIEGLKGIKKGSKVNLVSDSNYVLQGLSSWLESWKRSGWKTAGNKAVKNKDLWQELDSLIQDYELNYIKVKGHSGHKYNELVDALARKEINLHKDG